MIKWDLVLYIFATLYICTCMFMHVYICVTQVNTEDRASCTKHLGTGRNMVNSGYSLTKETSKKDKVHGRKIFSLISEARTELNPKSLWYI